MKGKCSLPQIVSIHHFSLWPVESTDSSCKQTEEREHRHSTFRPHVYHRLYILHWLCLKIPLHIQTTGAVCGWVQHACGPCTRVKFRVDKNEKRRYQHFVTIMFEHTSKHKVTGQSTKRLHMWASTLNCSGRVIIMETCGNEGLRELEVL